MRKGFSVTLAMVAFAMLVSMANASAPTISAIPDIIVGDAENVSANNVFVFQDAIDLNAKVEDRDTTDGGIIWTYTETAGSVAGARYLLNTVSPVPVDGNLVSNIVSGGTSNVYNVCRTSDPLDSNGPRTATIRDNIRSAYGTNGGLGPYTPSDVSAGDVWPGVILPDSRTLTLYASDGSTVSTTTGGAPVGEGFVVYSRNNGYDAISGLVVVYNPILTGTSMPSGWGYQPITGTCPGTNTTGGMCLTVAASANPANDAVFFGPYGCAQLVANCVWEARMQVTTTATVDHTPLFMFEYDNYGSSTLGANEFNGEFYYLDRQGGANSPIPASGGRSEFDAYIMPVQQQTPQFSDSTYGFYSSAMDAGNDIRVLFRVFDYGTSYGANEDSGSVCWKTLEIDRFDLSDKENVGTPTMSFSTFSNAQVKPLASDGSSWAWDYLMGAPALTGWGTANAMQVNPPNATAWGATGDFLMFHPGDYTTAWGADASVTNDNWPIDWVSNSTYYIEFQLTAISATAETTPVDMIRVGADTFTSELANVHTCTSHVPDLSPAGGGWNSRGLSMPRVYDAAKPQKYACFFYTHNRSLTASDSAKRWRPRFEIICSPQIASVQAATSNPNGLIVRSVLVQKCTFRGQQ